MVHAIQHAQTVVNWQENLLEEDTPPEWMWPLDFELEAWFDDVKRRRESRSDQRNDDLEEPPLVKNPSLKIRR